MKTTDSAWLQLTVVAVVWAFVLVFSSVAFIHGTARVVGGGDLSKLLERGYLLVHLGSLGFALLSLGSLGLLAHARLWRFGPWYQWVCAVLAFLGALLAGGRFVWLVLLG